MQAVVAPVAAAQAYVRAQSVAHLDETGWREGRARVWLWVAVTTWVTVFVVRLSRGAKVAQELLGERFCGLLVTDRWSAYTWYPTRWRRQVCWAHLLRDFEAMSERGGRSQEIGESLREQARQMFHAWHRVRDGSFGTQSAPGSRFVEAMMTVVATLKQQHCNVLAYMTEACQAAYTGLPAPALLPRHTEAEEDLPVAA